MTTKIHTSTNDSHGVEVRVGRPPFVRTLTIPCSALRASPALQRTVVQGCHILNADPVVFVIILEYLDSRRILARLRIGTQNPLAKLAIGSDMMHKLAKAWHIADMLQLPQLQNKLVATFREIYLHHLKSQIRIRVELESFEYLKNHLGTHTSIEKFIIEFYAGLAQFGGDFSAEELEPLPRGLAALLKQRREQFVAQKFTRDLIASRIECFNMTGSENTQRHPFQVVMPAVQALSNRNDTAQSRRRGFSVSSITSFFSSSSNSPKLPPSTDLTRSTDLIHSNSHKRDHHVRVSLPGITSLNGQPEILAAGALMPVLQSTFGVAIRPRSKRSHSMMTLLPSCAPFMPPPYRRRRAMTTPYEDSSDGEGEDGLFPPRVKSCEELARYDEYGAARNV